MNDSEQDDFGKKRRGTGLLDLSTMPQEETDYYGIEYEQGHAARYDNRLLSFSSLFALLKILLVVSLLTGLFVSIFLAQRWFFYSTVIINSTPSESLVYINNTLAGKTPLQISLAQSGYKIDVYNEGYATSAVYLNALSRQKHNINVNLLLKKPLNLNEFEAKIASLKTPTPENSKLQNALQILTDNIEYHQFNMVFLQWCKDNQMLDFAQSFYNDLQKHSVSSYVSAGKIESINGNEEEALELFMKAWRINEHDKILLNALAEHFKAQNQPERAREYWQMSVFLYPDQSDIIKRLNNSISTNSQDVLEH